MKDMALPNSTHSGLVPLLTSWLSGAVKAWVIAVLIGQWMFGLYILVRFTFPWLGGDLDEAMFSHMIRGYRNGETFNNGVLLVHIIPVIIISLSATLQLVPAIRTQYPSFHRWNGRVFLTIGMFGAISGLYMTWGIGSRLSDLGAIGVTLNGLLIPLFAIYAWRTAINKQFQQHRRFAVHTMMLINGVWTVRLYLMAWYMVNQGPLGNTSTIDGPADIAISFASYLLPMAIAELVFWTQKNQRTLPLFSACIGASILALITIVGVFAASTMMWIPRITVVL